MVRKPGRYMECCTIVIRGGCVGYDVRSYRAYHPRMDRLG